MHNIKDRQPAMIVRQTGHVHILLTSPCIPLSTPFVLSELSRTVQILIVDNMSAKICHIAITKRLIVVSGYNRDSSPKCYLHFYHDSFLLRDGETSCLVSKKVFFYRDFAENRILVMIVHFWKLAEFVFLTDQSL